MRVNINCILYKKNAINNLRSLLKKNITYDKCIIQCQWSAEVDGPYIHWVFYIVQCDVWSCSIHDDVFDLFSSSVKLPLYFHKIFFCYIYVFYWKKYLSLNKSIGLWKLWTHCVRWYVKIKAKQMLCRDVFL